MQFSLERVEELRREKTEYKTNGALAEAADVPRDLFTNLKRGKQKTVRLELAERIALKLGTSVDYLYGLTDDPGRKKNRIAPELALLSDEIAVLSPARQRDLAAVVTLFQQMDRAEMRWRESYMRIVDMLLDSKESAALATALELSIAGDDAAAVELIDAILGKRNAKQTVDKPDQ